jgi:hypothetical protein
VATKKKLTKTEREASLKLMRKHIDAVASAMGANTLLEVGIADNDKLFDVLTGVEILYAAGPAVPSDHWPYTPLMDRTVNHLNSMYNLHMTGFHVWQLLHRSRKHGTLPHSGAAGRRPFATGTKFTR